MGTETCMKPYTNRDKWIVAVLFGILFFILASPYMFKLTNSLVSTVGLYTTNVGGLPSLFGLIVHMIIFILMVRLLMK